MLGYETVWIVLVPLMITELIFPERRHEAWLRPRGIILAVIAFAVGAVMLWALFTQVTVPIVFHQPKYYPPLPTLLLGVLAIVMLIAAAYALRRAPARPTVRQGAPPPWLVGVSAIGLSVPWWALIVLVFAPRPALPIWLPLVAGTVWATVAFVLISRWSRTSGWGDEHRWALSFGALLVCMAAGFIGSSVWPAIDLLDKIALNIAAVVLMISLARTIRRHEVRLPA
jgi:hypothetical protein